MSCFLFKVRELARHLGLPNWSHAASPCLRSRLAWGVVASEAHLRLVEKAELEVRRRLAGTLQVRARDVYAGRKAVWMGRPDDLWAGACRCTTTCGCGCCPAPRRLSRWTRSCWKRRSR